MLTRVIRGRMARYVVIAMAGALFGAGGLAFASSTGRVIHTCANKQTGALRLATLCKKKEKAVFWNVQGPQGLQGPRGLQGAQGAPGSTGQPGTPGAPGAPATKLFATVMGNGTIDASSPGVQVFHGSTGAYEVNFGQDVSHCAALASIGTVPIYSSPGSSTGRTPGYALADLSSAGLTLPGSNFPSGDTVEVETIAGSTDAFANTSFNVAVFC